MQLIIEVTTGDDLALDAMRRDEELMITIKPEPSGAGQFIIGDQVKATLHSVAYVPEEALE